MNMLSLKKQPRLTNILFIALIAILYTQFIKAQFPFRIAFKELTQVFFAELA